jgi:hypothetical protein
MNNRSSSLPAVTSTLATVASKSRNRDVEQGVFLTVRLSNITDRADGRNQQSWELKPRRQITPGDKILESWELKPRRQITPGDKILES